MKHLVDPYVKADLRAWGLLVGLIWAVDPRLPRFGFRMWSHTVWDLLDDPKTRWLPVGAWGMETAHLLFRQSWGRSAVAGALTGLASSLTRMPRFPRSHLP